MESKQISLPENIYNIYNFYSKKYLLQDENPFKICKKIYNLDLYLAKNINNLNYYYIDFPINFSTEIHCLGWPIPLRDRARAMGLSC
jgi:hypothetical protein